MTIQHDREARAREVLAAAMQEQADTSPTANEWFFILRHLPNLSERGAVAAAIRAMLAFSDSEHAPAGWNDAIEAAARVADGAYHGDKAKEAEYLASSKSANSTSGREVDLEYAVSFARRANGDAAIARAIRALAQPTDGERVASGMGATNEDASAAMLSATDTPTPEPAAEAGEPISARAQREADAVTEMFHRYQQEGEFTVSADVAGCGRITIAVSRYAAICPPSEPDTATAGGAEHDALVEAGPSLAEALAMAVAEMEAMRPNIGARQSARLGATCDYARSALTSHQTKERSK